MKAQFVLARQRIGESFGGAEGYAAMLAKELRKWGSEVFLLAQSVDAEMSRCGFPVVRAETLPTNVLGVVSFARAVSSYAHLHPDRIILSFDRIPGVGFIRAGDGCHRAYLESMGQTRWAGLSLKHRMLLSLERRAFTHPSLKGIIANSQMVAEDIRKHYDVPKSKIRVVYTGLADDPTERLISRSAARARLNIPEDRRVLLFAGHNYDRKGLGTLLEALAQVGRAQERSTGWLLLVAGEGDIAKYRTTAEQFGIGDRVIFLGPRRLGELFPAADLFVLPTRYDPLARVCLEAARAGLPVITTRRNGFYELIGAGEGYVMDRETAAGELAGILQKAIEADLPAMGRRLKDRTARLSLHQNALEIVDFIYERNAVPVKDQKRRVLILKPSSFGDIVHSLPVVSTLAKQNVEVHFSVRREYREFVEMCPAVARIIDFPKRLSEVPGFLGEVRRCEYDAVIDLQGLFRSGLAAALARTRLRIGLPDSREGSIFFYDESAKYPEGTRHAVDRYLAVLKRKRAEDWFDRVAVDWSDPNHPEGQWRFDKGWGIDIPAEAAQEAEKLTGGGDYIVFSPLTRRIQKMWVPDRWADLAAVLAERDRRVVVVGAGESELTGRKGRWINLINRTSLPVLCAVIARANLCVSVDSAPMHLAAAFGVPVIALFGPTDPSKVGPYTRRRIIVRGDQPRMADLSCGAVASLVLSELQNPGS